MESEYGRDINCSDETYCFSDVWECSHFTPYLENLTFILGNNHYTIPPEGYMFSGNGIENKMCTIAISFVSDSMGYYIVGDSFLRNFVATFDNDRS